MNQKTMYILDHTVIIKVRTRLEDLKIPDDFAMP